MFKSLFNRAKSSSHGAPDIFVTGIPAPGHVPPRAWPLAPTTTIVDRAEAEFRRAMHLKICRTQAFIHAALPDRRDFMIAQATNDELSSWDVKRARVDLSLTVDGESEVHLSRTTQEGVGFLTAMRVLAQYEQAETMRLGIGIASAYENVPYFRTAAEAEGLIFTTDGVPQPTWDGLPVVDGRYSEEAILNIKSRPNTLPSGPVLVDSVLRAMTRKFAETIDDPNMHDDFESLSRILNKTQEALTILRPMFEAQGGIKSLHEHYIKWHSDRIGDSTLSDLLHRSSTVRTGLEKLKDIVQDDTLDSSIDLVRFQEFYYAIMVCHQLKKGFSDDKLNEKNSAESQEAIDYLRQTQTPDQKARYDIIALLEFSPDPTLPIMPKNDEFLSLLKGFLNESEKKLASQHQQSMNTLLNAFNKAAGYGATDNTDIRADYESQRKKEKLNVITYDRNRR